MSKKKDPNDIRFSAALRSNELTRKRLHKRIPKDMDWLHRVADEYADLQEKILKLGHALWRMDDDCPTGGQLLTFTEFAKGLEPRDRKLLEKQHKAMLNYGDTLAMRLMRFKANIFTPKH